MSFKLTNPPFRKSAFKTGGHGGEAYHTHVKPSPGAPTANPNGMSYLTQEVINKMHAANIKSVEMSKNRPDEPKKRKKGKSSGYSGGSPGSKGKKNKSGGETYKCTGGGCGAFD